MAESKEEMDYWRIISLLYKVAPSAVRVKFDKEFHPTNGLEAALKQDKWRVLEPLKRKRIIHQVQWDLLFPISGPVSSTTFDLTLMICLIRHLTPIQIGDNVPQSTDVSTGADLSRLKYYRNKFAHHDGCRLTERDFEIYCSEICQAILRLGGQQFKEICEDLIDMTLNNNEKEILLEIRNLEKASTFVPKALQKIHEDLIYEWREDENKVVKTRAISRIDELLETKDVIVAVGSSGCGKSTAIHHVALRLNNDKGYKIVPVHSPEDIVQYCEPKYKQVFVIDDVCGKSTINIGLINRWETLSTDIKKIIADHKVKILLSCRKHIYLDRLFKVIELLSETSCDFVSDYSLTKMERHQIARTYLTESEMNALKKAGLVEKFSFFPLLCCLYSKQTLTGVLDFFANPISVIRGDLELSRKATDQTTLATLSLFIVFNNSLNENMLSRLIGMTELLENISYHFDLQRGFSTKIVKTELQRLEMSYVKKNLSTYKIIHDKIYDIFLSFCGEHFLDLVLEVAHTDVIRNRFILESIQNEDHNLTKDTNFIKVPIIKETQYFDRILKDIQKDSKDIFLNRQFKCMTFRKKLFQNLENQVDIKQVLLDVSSEDLSYKLLSMTRQCYWDMVPILLTEQVDINVRDWEGTPLYFALVKGNIDIAKVLLENQADPNKIGWLGMVSRIPLRVAVVKGDIDLVKLLLAHHADANVYKKYIGTKSLLHLAIKKKNDSIVNVLLDHGADYNVFDDWNRTPLYETVRQESPNLTMLLLNHGADPNIGQQVCKNTPLHVACTKGNIYMIKMLLDYNADINIKNEEGETPLFQSIEKNQTDVVKFLLEHNCDPYICNNQNISPLFAASEKGHIDIVRFVLKYSCYPNTCKSKKISPVYSASSDEQADHADIVRLLLEHKCDPNICMICSDNSISPVFAASKNGHIDIVRLLLQHNCDPYMCMICNFLKISALLAASANGRIDIVELLLELQSDPNICNVKNISPLFLVLENDHTDIVRLLLKLNNESAVCLDSTKEHTNTVKLFLERKCDLNICNTRNESALFIAVNKMHTDIVKILLEHRCNPNICNDRKESPLFIASIEGHADIVKLLLEHKCDPNICNIKKESPLFIASEKRHADIVTLLLKHKCDPNICNIKKESPLFIASEKCHSDIVKLLLKHKCDPNICNIKKESPLFIASEKRHSNIVTLLLEHKCDPNICNDNKESPLVIASRKGHADIVRLLLKYKCDPNICFDSNHSPLFIACKEGHTDIVKLLLEHKCDPNICNDRKESPLFIASIEGHTDIVKLLLEHKCDPNICNDRKQSPLLIASMWYNVYDTLSLFSPYENGKKKSFTEIVRLLLEHNCDPNICNDSNESQLSIACNKGLIDIVKLLFEKKCDPDICNDRKLSPISIACLWYDLYVTLPVFSTYGNNKQKSYIEIVRLLLDYNCDSNICNDSNESPLSFACKKGLTDIVKLLLEHKCDPNICNDRKQSPLFIASMWYDFYDTLPVFSPYRNDKKKSYTEIVRLLLEHNCNPNICNDSNESQLSIACKEGLTDC